MVVFSNRRLGPSTELLLSPAVASAILEATAMVAAPRAAARWEHELVRWLVDRAVAATVGSGPRSYDISDIAWTPDHFEAQRRFLMSAITGAIALVPEHEGALRRWRLQVETHPRESVVVGRRWTWTRTVAATT